MTLIQASNVQPGDMVYAGPKPGATQFVGKAQEVYHDPRSVAVLIILTYAGKRLSRSYHKDHRLWVIRTA